MLKIEIPEGEFFIEEKNEFVVIKPTILQLEHSLVSISKWESKWHKPFLSEGEKTIEETIDYIKCMTLTQNVNPLVYFCINNKVIRDVNEYIANPMTATTFSNNRKKGISREIITSELIYYWMIANNIPMECQKWHLNRLFTLIKVCDVKNTPPEKMSRNELARRNSALNAARRKKLHTKG